MAETNSFADLPDRLRTGDADAAREVFDRYARRLIGLARTRIEQRLRTKVDADDIVQSVLRSFFVRQARGEFEIQDWDSLWALLVRITVRKCAETGRKHHALRRDVSREQPGSSSKEDGDASCWEAPSREPTAEEVACLHETVEQVMNKLSETQREILALHLQGYDPAEISGRVARSETAVYRTLRMVRTLLVEDGDTLL